MVGFDMVRCGMVWFGVVGSGMVWSGMVRQGRPGAILTAFFFAQKNQARKGAPKPGTTR